MTSMLSENRQLPKNNKGFALNLTDEQNLPSSARIKIVEKPLPILKKGQVLVKMLASPVNPSDLVHLLGKYGVAPVENAFVGFEGVGIVVQSNAGIYGKWLVGKRVALSAQPGIDGLWAEYAVTKANYCLPVHKSIPDTQDATLIVNQCTAVCLVDRAILLGAKAIVLNAAASQVGKGVIRYAQMRGIKVIATVRSEQNIIPLRQLGAEHVLLTTDEDFQSELKDICHQLHASVFLDAVAADDTPLVLRAMPKGSSAIVYGRLTETHDPIGGRFAVSDVIFRDIRIEGFWLATHIAKASALSVLLLSRKVQKLFMEGVFNTDIFAITDFNAFPEALDHYAQHKSDGKVIFTPT